MSVTTERFVEPVVVTSHFHLREGDVVADFGAGRGFFLEPLRAAVGGGGVVYALEIQKNLVETIGDMIRQAGWQNVRVIWADLEEEQGSTLEDDCLDVALVINSLFQFDAKATALEEMYRTLRPGGKLFIIDWSESFGNLGPAPEAVVTEAAAKVLAETAGFVFERTFPAGTHHYGLAYRKP